MIKVSDLLDLNKLGKMELVEVRPTYAYALQIRPLEWLKNWHEKSELNPASFSDVNISKVKVGDDIAMQLIQNRGGISAIQVRNLSDADKAVLFGRLVNEERLGFAQLSRLTGISKGEIKRLLLQMEDDL